MEVTEVMIDIQKEGVENVFPLASDSRVRFLEGDLSGRGGTILNAMAGGLAGVPAPIYTTLLYLVLGLLSFLVPSSSGLAALTMPILGPLTQLIGVNPEAAVTALAMANQTINTISPTAGMTVAGLAVCKISFGQWWKTCWKFMLLIAALGIAVTAVSGMLPA